MDEELSGKSKSSNDMQSTKELIEAALGEENEDARWEYVATLHRLGSCEVFDAARDLCESGVPLEETLGADILGQLGIPELPFKKESVLILLKVIDSENDVNVVQAATMALGRMEDSRAIEKLLELRNHANEDVRLAVTHGLLTLEDDSAVNVLIGLSSDEDEDVRNWATFGLGSMINLDTSEIRDALAERLIEADDEIRGEALVGLATRRDEPVVEPLLSELSREWVGTLAVEAAREIGDARLCKPLLKLKTWWNVDEDLLKEAIDACCESGSK